MGGGGGSTDVTVETFMHRYDGVYNTYDDEHMWLAPYKPVSLHPILSHHYILFKLKVKCKFESCVVQNA